MTTENGLPAALIGRPTSSIGWKQSTCESLQQLMRNDVQEVYGQSQFGDLAVCAKSGTAEVGTGLELSLIHIPQES